MTQLSAPPVFARPPARGARLVAVSISSGGIPKRPLAEAEIETQGVVGDAHAHDKHNRPDRALSILDLETIRELADQGYAVAPGVLGENLTVVNLDLKALASGDLLRIGSVVLRLEQPRKPCYVLDAIDPRIQHLLVGRCGWMASVVEGGTLRPDSAIKNICNRTRKRRS